MDWVFGLICLKQIEMLFLDIQYELYCFELVRIERFATLYCQVQPTKQQVFMTNL